MRDARARLRMAGVVDADLDARLLVADTLGLDAAELVMRSGDAIGEDRRRAIAARIERRAAGEPVHRIIGRRAFYAHEFRLSQATLEPRPDTETLVELCRAPMAEHIRRKGRCVFVDVGTGTGAIAISLLALFPQAQAIAIDLAPQALETAAANARDAGVDARFRSFVSDHLIDVTETVDMVVSNPPYIPTGDLEALEREVREHDPRLALDGGEDGLRSYRALAEQAPPLLAERGEIALEIGAGQGNDVRAIFAKAGFVMIENAFDLAGRERALLFRRSSSVGD